MSAVTTSRLPLRAVNTTPVQPTYRRMVRVGSWLLRRIVDADWDDAASLPRTGGVIVVANHISDFDPPCLAHYLVWHGRWPRALAKTEIFHAPIIGWLARHTGQIEVERGTERARDALIPARQALDAGECIVIYPEGTKSKDPDGWPMTTRPGVATLALQTGCPVIPVGQWGAQQVMPVGSHGLRLRPRTTVTFRMGPAVKLDDLGDGSDPTHVAEAGTRISGAITGLVAGIRGLDVPPDVYDVRVGRRVPRQ